MLQRIRKRPRCILDIVAESNHWQWEPVESELDQAAEELDVIRVDLAASVSPTGYIHSLPRQC